MATKRKEAAATAKPARGRRPAPRAAVKAADPLGAVTAERDALRIEVAALRARIETLVSVRSELETRLESAVSAVQKLLGRTAGAE